MDVRDAVRARTATDRRGDPQGLVVRRTEGGLDERECLRREELLRDVPDGFVAEVAPGGGAVRDEEDGGERLHFVRAGGEHMRSSGLIRCI